MPTTRHERCARRRKFARLIAIAWCVTLFVACSTASEATSIHYDVENVSANTWRYHYFVENDSLSSPIHEFTIFFDLGLYSALQVFSNPSDWDSLVAQPDPALPDDGFFDALALGGGIATGSGQGGFSVQFEWLGGALPAAQFFTVVDPVTFETLDSGLTEARTSVVPEPGTLWLLGTALTLSARSMRKKYRGGRDADRN